MMMMNDTNRQHLIHLGEALYGSRWQHAVSRDLGVGHQQVQRWLKGTTPPDSVIRELLVVARARCVKIEEAIITATDDG